MECPACGYSNSKYDVHCRSCHIRLYAQPFDEQCQQLGIKLEPDMNGQSSAAAQDAAATAVMVAANVGVSLLSGVISALPGFADYVFLDSDTYQQQAIIERAVRRSRN